MEKVKNYLHVVLNDDGSLTGGTAFNGERVTDFIADTDLTESSTIEELNTLLKANGIQPIKK